MKVRSFTFLLLSLIVACNSEPPQKLGAQELSFAVDTLILGKAENGGIDFYVEDLQIIDSSEVGKAVNIQVREHLVQNNVNFGQEFETYQSLYRSLKEEREQLEADGFEESAAWDLSQGVEVYLNQEGLFGINSFHSAYTGGAHANSYRSSLLFRLIDGAELKLDSILIPGSKDQIAAKFEAKLRLQYEVGEKESLNEAGFWFAENQFRLSEQFIYKPEGISIYYNSYEIGPYAMGLIEVFLPYEQVVDLIRPEYQFEAPLELDA